MKWSGRGIGWLIAGALICATAFPGNGIADVISTIAIGLVFIVIFLMKQRFQPRGLGWFIAGGILLAFAVDCFFNQLGAFFSKDGGADSGLLSDMIIALIIACGFMYMFYRRNRGAMEDVANGAEYVEESEFPYQEEVFKEETVTTETEQAVITPEEETKVEFEVSDGK